MRVLPFALAAALLAGCAASPAAETEVASAADPFVGPYSFAGGILDLNVSRTGEPSLAIDVDGTVYVCAPAGAQDPAKEDPGLNFIWRSDDGGATFQRLPTTGREAARGGGDCDIAIGEPGQLFEIGLDGLVATTPGVGIPCGVPGVVGVPCRVTFAASDDEGETWRDAQTVSHIPVNDRQWITAHDGAIYVTWQQIDTGVWVAKSTDGGRTFLQHSLAFARYANEDLQRHFIEGPIRVSPVDGTVYVPDASMNGLDFWGVPNPTPKHESYGNVAVSEDGGLTWTSKKAPGVPTGWAFHVDAAGNLYAGGVACDRDEAGNVTGCAPQLWISKDKASSWEGPYNVTVPAPLRIAHLWLAAGSDGRVALGMYASEKLHFAEDDEEGDWHLYLAATTDALEGDAAAWTFQRVLDEPVHRGVLRRDLVDFLSVVVSPLDGMPHLAYTTTVGKPEDEPYGRIGHARALSGPSLLSADDLAKPRAPQKNLIEALMLRL